MATTNDQRPTTGQAPAALKLVGKVIDKGAP